MISIVISLFCCLPLLAGFSQERYFFFLISTGVPGECPARNPVERLEEGGHGGAGGSEGTLWRRQTVGSPCAAQAEGQRRGPAGLAQAGGWRIVGGALLQVAHCAV